MSQTKRHFWTALESFDASEGVLFLRFVWARDRLNAFATARVRFQVQLHSELSQERLPTSETCFFNLTLPCYATPELLAQRLRIAMTSGSGINF